MRKASEPIGRFVTKIAIHPFSLCWEWTAGCFSNGYGAFAVSRSRTTQAHRWSYEWFIGPIPAKTEIDHLCAMRRCVNPNHLEAVAHALNMERSKVGAPRRLQTLCFHGHPLTEANVWRRSNGQRQCRECNRIRQQATRDRKKANATR